MSPPTTAGSGLLLQDPLLFPHLSVAANVAFAPRSGSGSAARLATHALAGRGEATEFADRMPRQLSGGQAQRVALARALAAEPDVLLLDEPMAGLDVAAAAAMRKLLRHGLTRDGRSAVLITHDVLDVLTLADRVLILETAGSSKPVRRQRFWPHPKPFRRAVRGSEPRHRHRGSSGGSPPTGAATWHGNPACRHRGGTAGGGHVPAFRRRGLPRQAARQPEEHRRSSGCRTRQQRVALRVRADEQPDGGPGLAADITAESAADLRVDAGGARLLLRQGAGSHRSPGSVTAAAAASIK